MKKLSAARPRLYLAGMVALFIGAGLVACDHDTAKASCFDMSAPGVLVYVPGIDLVLRDRFGRGEALGTTVIVHNGNDSVVTTGIDTLHVPAGYTYAGTFSVRVTRPFYRDTVLSNVVVQAGDCSVKTLQLPLTLQLAPGAPSLRSVGVFGADFLSTPGTTRQLTARFDADPGIPTTVSWRVSDAALADINAAGLVTAKCSLAGGTETVTAVATADTTVRGSVNFGVQKQTTCS
jgi:hypothetical protein